MTHRFALPVFEDESERRWLWALVAVFVITRIAMAFLAGTPRLYTGSGLPVTPYVYESRDWGLEIVASGRTPYAGVPIEYPPGLLPFVLLPASLLHTLHIPFLPSFVVLMTAVDALGLIGLRRLSARWGSRLGPWLWVIGLPLLGPMVLLRLDLVPAVALVWAIERAAADRWTGAGGLVGFGILAKIYPAFLFPIGLAIARSRARFTVGALAVVVVGLAPFVLTLDALIRSVAGFHFHRGVQIESVWGNALLVARELGYEAGVLRAFGSWEIVAGVAPLVEALSTASSIAVVGALAWWVWRTGPRGDPRLVALAWFVTLACLLVTGRVLSPQFLIWLVGLGATVACAPDGLGVRSTVLFLGTMLLTQIEFPFAFSGLLAADRVSIGVLTTRNVFLIALAVSAIRRLMIGADRKQIVAQPTPSSGAATRSPR